MAKVSYLYIYPIKSCGGTEVSDMELTEYGPRYDRQFMLTDEDGKFLSQRELPRMCLIRVEFFHDFSLNIQAPEMPLLSIPKYRYHGELRKAVLHDGEICYGIDQGDEIANWFNKFLNKTCRLIRYTDTHPRIRFSKFLGRTIVISSFADSHRLLIISEESLCDLNERLKNPLPMNRFRPNIIVSGCNSYEEDTWQEIQIDSVVLHGANRSVRCTIPTTDQDTGERNKEPLRTLAKYRKTPEGVVFGKNYNNINNGIIHKGDLVEIKR